MKPRVRNRETRVSGHVVTNEISLQNHEARVKGKKKRRTTRLFHVVRSTMSKYVEAQSKISLFELEGYLGQTNRK